MVKSTLTIPSRKRKRPSIAYSSVIRDGGKARLKGRVLRGQEIACSSFTCGMLGSAERVYLSAEISLFELGMLSHSIADALGQGAAATAAAL